MNTEKTIIEINGVKMEVDLRNAKKIENYKVGDNVKVLIKEYESFKSYLGTIIGFDNFKETPTIVIAYLKTDYSEATIKFAYYNSKSKDIELCHLNEWDVPVSKPQVIDRFNILIENKKKEIQEMEQKMNIFERLFGKFFKDEFNGITNIEGLREDATPL